MPYRVTAPFVYLKLKDPVTGAFAIQGFYEGAVVDDVDPDNLRHHLDLNMVEEVAGRVAVEDPGPDPDEHYEPSEHTVDEVIAHLATLDDAGREALLDAERAGKARVGVLQG